MLSELPRCRVIAACEKGAYGSPPWASQDHRGPLLQIVGQEGRRPSPKLFEDLETASRLNVSYSRSVKASQDQEGDVGTSRYLLRI